MSFCSKCGTQVADDVAFCPSCGTATAQQTQPQTQQPVYGDAQTKRPGRGLAIAGMILGIIGLVIGFSEFISAIAVAGLADVVGAYGSVGDVAGDAMLSAAFGVLVESVLSILAVCFAAVSKKKGYRSGVRTSGMVLGVIGLVFFAIAIIVCLTI